MKKLALIRKEIIKDPANRTYTESGYDPLFVAHEKAKLLIVGQAPGIKAQTAGRPWDDESGKRLMDWLGIDESVFRDEKKIAHLPMDFYYPGKGKSGDLPPRKDFADKWHPRLLEEMPHIKLIILVGQYAQKYYLGKKAKKNLTETVRAYKDYLPDYFPLVHPSPLNFRWHIKNPWFVEEVIPFLQKEVARILKVN